MTRFRIYGEATINVAVDIEVEDGVSDGSRANLMAMALDEAFTQVNTRDIRGLKIDMQRLKE